MKVSILKKDARHALKGKWRIAIGMVFLIGLLSLIIGAPTVIVQNWFSESSILAVVANLFTQIIMMPITVGFYWFYLDLYDGKALKASQIFNGYKQAKKVWGIQIMVNILILLWTLLLIIPGIIKAISYSQAIYIIKDNPKMGVFEAITESKQIMKGHRWKYVLTILSFLPWLLVVPVISFSGVWLFGQEEVILFVIAIILNVVYMLGILLFIIPYQNTTLAAFYRQLKPSDSLSDEE